MLRALVSYIVFLLLVTTVPSRAQLPSRYNLNIYNGLPDNHVYNCLVDRHGYLWMTTPKGVVRYNGYETRIFNLSSGLPNEDVWKLFEDGKGRIWLGSIANTIGYIYKGEYKTATIPGFNNTIYPNNLKYYLDSALMFWGTYKKDDNKGYETYVFIESNDSFRFYRTLPAYYIFRTESPTDKRVVAKYVDSIYELSFTPRGIERRSISHAPHYMAYQQVLFGNNVLQLEPKSSRVDLLQLPHGRAASFTPSSTGEKVLFAYALGDTLTVYFETRVCSYDTGLNLRYCVPVSELVGDNLEGNSLLYVMNDKRWGRTVTTKDQGAYITYPLPNKFVKTDLQLNGFKDIGNMSVDSMSFWWNTSTNTLLTLKNDRVHRLDKFQPPISIRRLIPFSKEYALVFERFGIAWLNLKTYELVYEKPNFSLYAVEGAMDTANKTFLLTDPHGIYRYTVAHHDGRPVLVYSGHYSDQRYRRIHFSRRYQMFVAHNTDHILLISRSGWSGRIARSALTAAGIHNIELITSDLYGNIYIKQNNTLNLYVPGTRALSSILPGFILNGSLVRLTGNKLVVAGRFGVAIMEIQGLGRLKLAAVYSNIKGLNYSFVHAVKYYGDVVVLYTDKGTFTLNAVSAGADVENNNIEDFRFVAAYNDRYHDLQHGDTLIVQQSDRRITLDVINEKGDGAVVYSYRMPGDTSWTVLPGSELFLSDIVPGQYHSLSLVANDLACRSRPLSIYVYVQPHWWQTSSGVRIIWISGIAFAVLCIAVVILITRRVVTRKNEKRNLQLELELKAIYSQINPHFIFNTLSTALFFIKTNKPREAHSHIIKFSRLLRAYIRSSRNKYVSIADEIASLNNYVELQQVRFEDKFDYVLQLDEHIPQHTMKIPSLLLQPLVENAINHGIFHKTSGKGFLRVSFKINTDQNELICTIEDNGVGRLASRQINRNSMLKRESFGSDLVKDLIGIFNKYEQMQISMEYIDKKEPDTGTVVILKIKKPVND